MPQGLRLQARCPDAELQLLERLGRLSDTVEIRAPEPADEALHLRIHARIPAQRPADAVIVVLSAVGKLGVAVLLPDQGGVGAVQGIQVTGDLLIKDPGTGQDPVEVIDGGVAPAIVAVIVLGPETAQLRGERLVPLVKFPQLFDLHGEARAIRRLQALQGPFGALERRAKLFQRHIRLQCRGAERALLCHRLLRGEGVLLQLVGDAPFPLLHLGVELRHVFQLDAVDVLPLDDRVVELRRPGGIAVGEFREFGTGAPCLKIVILLVQIRQVPDLLGTGIQISRSSGCSRRARSVGGANVRPVNRHFDIGDGLPNGLPQLLQGGVGCSKVKGGDPRLLDLRDDLPHCVGDVLAGAGRYARASRDAEQQLDGPIVRGCQCVDHLPL